MSQLVLDFWQKFLQCTKAWETVQHSINTTHVSCLHQSDIEYSISTQSVLQFCTTRRAHLSAFQAGVAGWVGGTATQHRPTFHTVPSQQTLTSNACVLLPPKFSPLADPGGRPGDLRKCWHGWKLMCSNFVWTWTIWDTSHYQVPWLNQHEALASSQPHLLGADQAPDLIFREPSGWNQVLKLGFDLSQHSFTVWILGQNTTLCPFWGSCLPLLFQVFLHLPHHELELAHCLKNGSNSDAHYRVCWSLFILLSTSHPGRHTAGSAACCGWASSLSLPRWNLKHFWHGFGVLQGWLEKLSDGRIKSSCRFSSAGKLEACKAVVYWWSALLPLVCGSWGPAHTGARKIHAFI